MFTNFWNANQYVTLICWFFYFLILLLLLLFFFFVVVVFGVFLCFFLILKWVGLIVVISGLLYNLSFCIFVLSVVYTRSLNCMSNVFRITPLSTLMTSHKLICWNIGNLWRKMDEPMEAEADSTQPDIAPDDGDQRVKHHPLLRPGSMGWCSNSCASYPKISNYT